MFFAHPNAVVDENCTIGEGTKIWHFAHIMTGAVIGMNCTIGQNVFIASGRKVPRTGGIILALAKSKEEIEQIIREDPFQIHNLATFSITEFLTSQYHPEMKKILTGTF